VRADLDQALPAVIESPWARACAFSLLGIHEYLQRLSGDRLASQIRVALTARLMELYERAAKPDWPWFEDILSYDNAKLPHALILSGRATGDKAVLERGLKTMRWLMEVKRLRAAISGPSAATAFIRGWSARELRSTAHRGSRHRLGLS
jgi:hypothetical protein